MKTNHELRYNYVAPQTRVKDILFENCILSDTLYGSGGEDADDELEPGF